MTEAEASIRESLLNTLSFLASETQQREFAAKVFYASYQDEFACWWFDTFYPDEPSALHMFIETQLAILRSFSEVFDRNLTQLGDGELPVEQLLQKSEWQAVVASARTTSAQLASAT
jgi:hypothetical protein